MANSTDVWNDILHSTNKDELKKETNLIVLGNSKSQCLTLIDGIMDCLNLPVSNKRDIDILYYTYASIGYANRKNSNGDYLGILNIHCLNNPIYQEFLLTSSQQISLENTMFLINIDFSESYSIMSNLEKWMNMIIEYIGCITKENQIDYLHQKEQWKERVLSFVQHYQQTTLQQEGLNLQNTIFPEGLLLSNLGVPILVVCSNTEVIFQSSYYSEEIIDYIQKSLRSYCLHYGLSLSYYNTLKQKNIQTISSYILSLLYPVSYTLPPPQSTSKDELFIPLGFDNVYMIQDILQGKKLAEKDDYNSVIEKPSQEIKKQTTNQQPLLSEDQFLESLIKKDDLSPSSPYSARKSQVNRSEGSSKPRVSFQQLSSKSSTENNVNSPHDFFVNLIAGGNNTTNTQSAVPRKSVNVRNLRRSEAVTKK